MKLLTSKLLAWSTAGAAVLAQAACAQPTSALMAAASAPPPSPSPAASSAAKGLAARLLQDIKSEIGEAPCDSDSQCRTIGVGSKPCGGPESYLAWSSKSSDRGRLVNLVARHREARRLDNEASGLLSDCRVVPDPGAACRPGPREGQRACQTTDPRAGNGRQGAP